jgi:hypothetical protein
MIPDASSDFLVALWLKKVFPDFISGYPLKKWSWLSAFDLKDQAHKR